MYAIKNYYSKKKYVKEFGTFKNKEEASKFLFNYYKKRIKDFEIINWLMYPIKIK